MDNFALLFKFRDKVQGHGYLAGIEVEGRALLTQDEDGKFWFYGVNPGGMAQNGATPEMAYKNFRVFFSEILADFAEDAKSIREFHLMVSEFMADIDVVEAGRWQAARDALRAGERKPEGDFAKLPMIKEEVPARVVQCINLVEAATAPARSVDGAPLVYGGADKATEVFELAA